MMLVVGTSELMSNFDEVILMWMVSPLGQGVGLIHDIPTVKELFDRIMGEAPKTVSQLAS